mgnify:CR=1 FL=1
MRRTGTSLRIAPSSPQLPNPASDAARHAPRGAAHSRWPPSPTRRFDERRVRADGDHHFRLGNASGRCHVVTGGLQERAGRGDPRGLLRCGGMGAVSAKSYATPCAPSEAHTCTNPLQAYLDCREDGLGAAAGHGAAHAWVAARPACRAAVQEEHQASRRCKHRQATQAGLLCDWPTRHVPSPPH